MATKQKSTTKTHLMRPGSAKRAMCGLMVREKTKTTETPSKTNCKTCRTAHSADPKAYTSAKRAANKK